MSNQDVTSKSWDGMNLTKLNLGVGFAAITSNAWLPSLEAMSSAAALWVPVLGFILLVLQIIKLLWDWLRRSKNP